MKPFLNHHCTIRFYNSCIHNLFIYCLSAWGSFSGYLLSPPLRLRKRAARLILNDYFSQPSVSLFPKLDLIKLRKLVLLFTILNNPDAPLCLKRIFNFCLPFVQLICAPKLAILIFKFPSRGLILESAHLLTLLPPFLIALTLILSK